jgi:hypothetical protein
LNGLLSKHQNSSNKVDRILKLDYELDNRSKIIKENGKEMLNLQRIMSEKSNENEKIF